MLENQVGKSQAFSMLLTRLVTKHSVLYRDRDIYRDTYARDSTLYLTKSKYLHPFLNIKLKILKGSHKVRHEFEFDYGTAVCNFLNLHYKFLSGHFNNKKLFYRSYFYS